MLKTLVTAGLLGTVLIFSGCETLPNQTNTTELSHLAQLQNRTWVLTHIGNTEIKSKPNQQIPSLQFDAATQRVNGTDGCNRIMGSYQAGRDTLMLSQMTGTRMACLDTQQTAQSFHEALSKVTHYQVFGKTLKLLDRHGNPVLQLKSPIQVR